MRTLWRIMMRAGKAAGAIGAVGLLFWICWWHLVLPNSELSEADANFWGAIFTVASTVVFLCLILGVHLLVSRWGTFRRMWKNADVADREFIRNLWHPIDFCRCPLIPSGSVKIVELHLALYCFSVASALRDLTGMLQDGLDRDANPDVGSAVGHRSTVGLMLSCAAGLGEAVSRLADALPKLQEIGQKSLGIRSDIREIYDTLNTKAINTYKDDQAAEEAISSAKDRCPQVLQSLGAFNSWLSKQIVALREEASALRRRVTHTRACRVKPSERDVGVTFGIPI